MGSLNEERHTQISNRLFLRGFQLIDANHMFRGATVNDYLPAHSHKASGGILFDSSLDFPKQSGAAEGFLLVLYRITFVHQDFLSPQRYLGT